ncbi:phenylacetate-CoA oxygenase subunit PaaJ [Actinorhabdospora filicis]|uniref:Phenylacetate-CoA oxygenase subunit PaaJ n=1 Tax=Actinorhabdospora filicis TaxID=1785913 RepID=A0A9W6W8V4_9ACTN|nr:1,2-phenylacetyl-CoA epoxidase subunit PaaD [Actinorhabdospora filicis]GLZ76866.1 phenylacetate-CoA oxygenase subunit PaaJ [Actinorhabdospora filicis]
MTTAFAAAARVVDPELRVVTIADLGVLREVEEEADGTVRVTITPTYSGCPAMDAIRADIARSLTAAGYPDVEVRTVLSPAWTTDWITDEGRAKLAAAGTAPPPPRSLPLLQRTPVCPRCGSPEVEEISRFGSTACKSLWRCRGCAEPFDHVKVL